MRCLYCDQRLNFIKSLGGSSFCSPEHQKLYEEAQSDAAFERLLEFAKEDSKPTADPAEPTAPSTVEPGVQQAKPASPAAPEPQAVAESYEQAAEPAPEPQVVGFLREPIVSPAVSASSRIDTNFEIPESSFAPELPVLPSSRIENVPTDLRKPASEPVEEKPEWLPPPQASWAHHSLAEIEAPQAFTELSTLGPVRPRALALTIPSPETRPSEVRALSFSLSNDACVLQLPVQAVIDTRDFANLARLDPLPREAQTANAKAEWSSPKPGLPALSQPDAVGSSIAPQAKQGRDFTVGMIGAVTPASVGRDVSPAVLPPQPLATPGMGAVPHTILAGVQDAPGPGQPEVFTARLEQQKRHAPAMHWRAWQPAGAGLPRRAFANLKLDQDYGSTLVAMNRALTRAGLARDVRQPQAPASRLVGTLGSTAILNRVLADVQNAPGPPAYGTYSARLTQRECVVPAESTAPRFVAVIAPVVAARNLTVRASDTAVPDGITDIAEPLAATIPLCIQHLRARRSVAIVINRVAHKVQAQVQDKDGSRGCAISSARPARRECLLPSILWSSATWLGSAIAAVDWFQESDCAGQVFPSEAPATRLFSIRLARESFYLAVPAIAFHRTARRLTLEVCEWKAGLARSEQEAQRLPRFRPSGTSPLSLVALPNVCIAPRAVGFIATLIQFTSIANPANRGAALSVPASADEHNPAMALPPSPALGLSFAFLSQAALKSLLIQPVGRTFRGAALRPHPSPVRAQPASMLVLPGPMPARGSRAATLFLNPTRLPVSLDLDLDDETSTHGVPVVNPLSMRGGPTLPVVTSAAG